jgi:predicted nuclease of predicted toxin-antitoxin system
VTIWLDNHLSPTLARWIEEEFGEPCVQVRDLGLARAEDREIFAAASVAATMLISKDRDFADLVLRLGPPPGIVLLSCGNTSTAYVRDVLRRQLGEAVRMIRAGERIVEIGSAP